MHIRCCRSGRYARCSRAVGAEPVRSSGGAHTYCGGRDAATAVGLEMTAGASALGRRGHVQEDISSDAPAIAKSQLLAESAYRGDARGATHEVRLSIVRVAQHHPVLGQPLVCRMAAVVSLYRSSQTASVFDGGLYRNTEMRLCALDCGRTADV